MTEPNRNVNPSCPKCGAKMRIHIPKPDQDWKAFWGCNRFPYCAGSINIGNDGEPELEEDKWTR